LPNTSVARAPASARRPRLRQWNCMVSATTRLSVFLTAAGFLSLIACDAGSFVTNPTLAADARVSLSPSKLTLTMGESATITATVVREEDGSIISNPGITWTSSNPDVLQVDERGVLTTIALGRAIITAIAACCAGDSAEATVVAGAVGITDFPNMPAGMTLIGGTDGSVLGGVYTTETDGEPAFGVPGFGHWSEISNTCRNKDGWPENHIMRVDDPLNPSGSGRAIRLFVDENGCGGVATATGSNFGGYSELYFKWSLFLEHDRDRNIKMMYVGAGTNSHFSIMNHEGLYMLLPADPNGVRTIKIGDVFRVGHFVTVEAHLVAESVAGAGDGEYHVWREGVHLGSWRNVHWAKPGQERLFGHLQWYAHHSNRGFEMTYRIGEFHMAGR
jgi:hypothetical protein